MQKKIFAFILIALLVIISLGVGYAVHALRGISEIFSPPITKEQMEEYFARDFILLEEMIQHFLGFDYENLVITSEMESGIMYTGEGVRIGIDDSDARTAIRRLQRRGYRVMVRNGNSFSFVRWSNMDNGRGVVLSLDGSDPALPFLTRLEPLDRPNWFYYEEDFNEWRQRQRTEAEDP